MKRLSIFLFLMVSFASKCFERIVVVGIPKCGTHLIGKTLNLITNYNIVYSSGIKGKIQESDFMLTKTIFLTHCNYIPCNISLFDKYKNSNKYFLIYRDPRDAVVSLIYHLYECIDRDKNCGMTRKPVDEMITMIIKEYGKFFHADLTDLYLFPKYYSNFFKWSNDNKFSVIKYENLIGSAGLGDGLSQRDELIKIYNHLGINYSEDDLNNITSKIYGGTNSFRSGSIGKWKKYFKPHHKKLMLSVAGDLLIQLGYESDYSWAN